MSPELKDGQPLLPASDVYGLGVLLRIVSRQTPHGSLKAALQPLVTSCTQWDPEARPSLLQVVDAVHELKGDMAEAVLHVALYEELSEEQLSLPQAATETQDLQESQPEAVPDAALHDDNSEARPSLQQTATATQDLQESPLEAVSDAAHEDHSGERASLHQAVTETQDLQESQPEAVRTATSRCRLPRRSFRGASCPAAHGHRDLRSAAKQGIGRVATPPTILRRGLKFPVM